MPISPVPTLTNMTHRVQWQSMHQSFLPRDEQGLCKVTNDVFGSDRMERPIVLLCIAKKFFRKAKPSINIPRVGIRNKLVLGDGQNVTLGWWPSHPITWASWPPEDVAAIARQRFFTRVNDAEPFVHSPSVRYTRFSDSSL